MRLGQRRHGPHDGLFETGRRRSDRHEKYRCRIRTPPQDGSKGRRTGLGVFRSDFPRVFGEIRLRVVVKVVLWRKKRKKTGKITQKTSETRGYYSPTGPRTGCVPFFPWASYVAPSGGRFAQRQPPALFRIHW